MEKLAKMNIVHHYIDETILAKHGSVKDDTLICGKCNYKYIILPTMYTMDKTTEKLLHNYVLNGGKILLMGENPTYLEGEKYNYDYLKSNIDLKQIQNNQLYKINKNNTEIRTVLRKNEKGYFIYAVNTSTDESFDIDFKIKGYKSFEQLNIETLSTKTTGKKLHFKPYESKILFLSNKKEEKEKELNTLLLKDKFEVVESTDNYLTLDYVKYSFDGENYSEKLSCMGVFQEMLSKRYKGNLYLKYEFDIKEKPNNISVLVEDMNNQYVKVNGQEVIFDGVSDFEKQIYKGNISQFISTGKNNVEIKIKYYQDENVYYALFGEGVTESLKNCLVYNTSIESIYLCGDFGVYEKDGLTKGQKDNILIGKNFYIGGKKQVVTDLVKDGYLFFAGNIKLKQKISLDNVNYKLRLQGRYHIAKVKVNKGNTKVLMFDNEIDISNDLIIGNNEIEITLVISNRNLLGPHHYKAEEEPFVVSPNTFELSNTWENGKSKNHRDTYAFVKAGIF